MPSLKKNFPYFVQSTQVHGDIHTCSEKEAFFARSNSLKYHQNSFLQCKYLKDLSIGKKNNTIFTGKTNKLLFSEGWFIYSTMHLLISPFLTHQFYNIHMKNTPLIFVVNVYRNCVRSCSLICQALSTIVHLI